MTTATVRPAKPRRKPARKRAKAVVHSDPGILGGIPVFVGTRVPVKNLVDYLAGGDPLDEFLDQFPTVSREQAVAGLELARKLVEDRARTSR
jgi:uncharacterized protein (DUF433 family)